MAVGDAIILQVRHNQPFPHIEKELQAPAPSTRLAGQNQVPQHVLGLFGYLYEATVSQH